MYSYFFTAEAHPLIAIGILLLCGYIGGRLANRLKFPRVSGYIVVGILLSSSVTGIIPLDLIEHKLLIITDIALSIIAYAIGGSLSIVKLKRVGKSILWINLTEATGAFILAFTLVAFISPYILKLPDASFANTYLPLALIIGAVCAATAPAAVLAIVHECRAKGPLTTTLLGVVALDDGMAIILYAFAGAAVTALTNIELFSVYRMAIEPLIIIFGSVALGTAFGFLLSRMALLVTKRESLLVVILGGIFLCAGVATELTLSPLLANMMVGFFIVNRVKHSHNLFDIIEYVEEPVFALFFTVAGAHFDIGVIKVAGPLALLITLGRFTGKLIGTNVGARISGAPKVVRKYLALGLLPTAGVTIGLVIMAKPLLQGTGLSEIMVNAVLGSVIINELIAPPFVRYALIKGGEGREETE
jgi:Kef-type K+ transport system membrane component KefB